MVKIISEQPKKKMGKRAVLLAVILVVLIAGGVAAWYFVSHQPKAADKPAKVNDPTVVNTQSNAVKQATSEANKKASSGDTSGAIETLGAAAASSQDKTEKASLYSQQASLYAQSGNEDAAIAANKQAIQADPTDWKNYANLGFLYKAYGDKQNAIDYLKQALTVMKQQGATSGESSGDAEIQGALTQLGAS